MCGGVRESSPLFVCFVILLPPELHILHATPHNSFCLLGVLGVLLVSDQGRAAILCEFQLPSDPTRVFVSSGVGRAPQFLMSVLSSLNFHTGQLDDDDDFHLRNNPWCASGRVFSSLTAFTAQLFFALDVRYSKISESRLSLRST